MIQNIDNNVFIINGGSFNPPHNGHIRMFESAYNALIIRNIDNKVSAGPFVQPFGDRSAEACGGQPLFQHGRLVEDITAIECGPLRLRQLRLAAQVRQQIIPIGKTAPNRDASADEERQLSLQRSIRQILSGLP